ncbi:hypothetical protein [Tunturiibacter lichenicola]|uniref:hypothetical protein n=1 Tax=Tunturiibacter lichenicola TaxID=2051959 RepID=UPI003D9B97D6
MNDFEYAIYRVAEIPGHPMQDRYVGVYAFGQRQAWYLSDTFLGLYLQMSKTAISTDWEQAERAVTRYGVYKQSKSTTA